MENDAEWYEKKPYEKWFKSEWVDHVHIDGNMGVYSIETETNWVFVNA